MVNAAPIRFFVDFDGTIATSDVVDSVLERFADTTWKNVEEEWASGRIGSRECLSRQIALVSAHEADLDALLSKITIDDGFVGFVRRAAGLSVPVSVVSDGFDLFIHSVLKRSFREAPELLSHLPVICNRLDRKGNRLEASFSSTARCEHGCANCKPAVIRQLSRPGDRVIFVGDGLSDRYAARIADLTFAKSKLLEFCRQEALPHRSFSGFREIESWLEENRPKILLQR